MARDREAIHALRRAIDCLPIETRIAMLEGVQGNDIIVGAYAHAGGICPMLAAHRCGGRTSFLAFARSWDGFAKARKNKPRRASEREIRILVANLEASLLAEERVDLRAAIEEHRGLLAARPEPEPARRAWLGPFRSWDGYARAVGGRRATAPRSDAGRSPRGSRTPSRA